MMTTDLTTSTSCYYNINAANIGLLLYSLATSSLTDFTCQDFPGLNSNVIPTTLMLDDMNITVN